MTQPAAPPAAPPAAGPPRSAPPTAPPTAAVPRSAPPAFAPGGLAGMPGVATPSLRLPGEHFAAATMYLVAGSLGLVWVAPQLAAGLYLSPRVAGVTHLFTLGWLTMTIFGALYQLLPVALGAPVWSERLGHAGFWLFAPGVALFASGVAAAAPIIRLAGATLVTLGALVVIGNVVTSLPHARLRDATWWAVVAALAFLATTLVLGLTLVHNLESGFLLAARQRVLATHLHVALLGWVLMMIVGMSHRLLPMFLVAHGADTAWTRRAIALLAAGCVSLVAALVLDRSPLWWIALALLEGGVACFLIQARGFYIVRIRRTLDAGMRHARAALGFLLLAALTAPVVLAAGATHPRLATAYILVALPGGILLYVVGFFYKIVPFLAWIHRFRSRVGRGKVPTVADLYSARIARADLALFVAGVTGLAAGTLGGSAGVVRAGALAYVGAVALFASQIVRVARGRAV